MTDVAHVSGPIQLDQDGRLLQEINCIDCGYVLRGLKRDDHCPECGQAVDQSAKEDLLRFADPAWVRRMHIGVMCLLGVVVGFGGIIGAVFLNDVLMRLYPLRELMRYVVLAMLLGMAVLFTVGAWRCTSREPNNTTDDQSGVIKLARISSILIAPLILSTFAISHIPVRHWLVDLIWQELSPLLILLTILWALLALTRRAGALALRLPNRKLAKRCRGFAWATLAAIVIVFIAATCVGVLDHYLLRPWRMTGVAATPNPIFIYARVILSLIIWITLLTALISYIVTAVIVLRRLIAVRRQVKESQSQSAANGWVQPTPSPEPSGGRVRLDEAGHIIDDLQCIKCGYLLRGITLESRCPECGLATGRSAVGHWLKYCDPNWLRQLWRGLNCLSLLFFSAVAIVILHPTRRRLGSDILELPDPRYELPDPQQLLYVVTVISIFMGLGMFGWWKSTTPDPAKLGDEHPLSPRRLARWVMVAAVSLYILLLILTLRFHMLGNDFGDLLGKTIAGMVLIEVVFILWFARSLAKRIPQKALSAATTLLTVLTAITGVFYHAFAADWFHWQVKLKTIQTSIDLWYYLELIGIISAIVLMVLTVLIGLLLIWYWRAMKRQADEALRTWAVSKI